MEDLVLTDEEEKAVEEGEAATALLDSPIFLTAIERVRAQCAEQILTSSPADTTVREHLYNLSRGLSAVTEELASIAALGQCTLDNATRPLATDDVQPQADADVDY